MPNLLDYFKSSQFITKYLYQNNLRIINWIWNGGDLADGTPPAYVNADEIERIPYKLFPEEPLPVPIPVPPEPPINRIKPPVRNPFEPLDPTGFTIVPIVPPLPPRTLPPPPTSLSTNTEAIYGSNVTHGLSTRKYGCLLAKPFYNTDIEWCDWSEEEPQALFERIGTEIEQFIDKILDGVIEDLEDKACQRAIALLSLPFLMKPLLIMDCKHLDDIAKNYYQRNRLINNYSSTGMLPVGSVTVVKCAIPKEQGVEGDIPLQTKAECSIPLSLYADLEEYKGDQLQIIWRNRNWNNNNRFPKSIVFPSPRELNYYSEELFKSVLPQWHRSGLTKLYIMLQGIIPNAPEDECDRWKRESPIFVPYACKEDCDTFVEEQFKLWVSVLCSEDVRVKKYVSKGYSAIDIHEDDYYPYRAVYMGWDKDKKHWLTKAHWYIYKQQPQ